LTFQRFLQAASLPQATTICDVGFGTTLARRLPNSLGCFDSIPSPPPTTSTVGRSYQSQLFPHLFLLWLHLSIMYFAVGSFVDKAFANR
jgi:hypothetical protein